MRVFLSAGEPSGDHHAALLARALRARSPDVECVGLGGPQLAAEGVELVADMTRLAVMWFLRVILSIHRFVDLARRAERSFLDHRPDVCVLVDFPGFHWWLAWRAKRHGIPVVFYCPPQIWAWASWRKEKMRRLVDHVLAPLPFEHEWFTAEGISSTLVGHPFFDEFAVAPTRTGAVPAPSASLVLLLPGSRGQEISANLPSLLRGANIVAGRVPATRFVVAVLHDRHAAVVREMIARAGGSAVEVVAGRTRSLMAEARCAMAVSGSVSLELLAARLPAVIIYRIGGLAYIVQSWFRHARFITLVNLMAVADPILPVRGVFSPPRVVPPADPDAIYPEYLAVGDPAERAAEHVVGWLTDAAARRSVVERLDEVAARVARSGSASRAAAAVLAIAAGDDPAAAVRGVDEAMARAKVVRAA
ncbi:MAG: lipid-A-disaccharide synthase [Planctomycetota bacterium]|nr:MAG: lipid-A-disaccharide synthase [Planctomycetota bacterium]